ncbi:transcriptional regulator, GntR family protein [Pedobacter sp. BAL39]|uniref:aminotransferase-like domain-containing protein n=1 Tax=Pedobacter sp. BAL39 TaxID=391596 RepID=UPI00015594D2|nr:PLP-dependent aminotransferase family protein [Pedobacter sp. BAL39]EDM37988.1 transcriptional regulator, GntR family protein [Pedobacter sp. BAL39]
MPVQTLPFQSLIITDKTSTTPIYQQVANGLIKLIIEGKIRPGYGLPPSRTLAELMNLNRTTVVAAYEELRIQDWIQVIPRKGIFVSGQLPVIKPRTFRNELQVPQAKTPIPDFYLKLTNARPQEADQRSYDIVINDGYPDSRVAPLTALLSKYKSLSSKSYMDRILLEGSVAGSANLRTELAVFLSKTRGINADSEQVMVTRGAQVAIFMAARMMIKPGSTVIVGDLNYNLANEVFTQAGATLIKVKVDENGMDIDEVERICKTKKPDLLYIIPHHHHPTTVTLSAERRMKLLHLIQIYQFPVIEDDYDYDFHYDNCPILPLASADHKGYVVYIGSITKTLAPSIKMGYIVADKEFIWQLVQFKKMMEIRGDILMEEAVASLYSSGEMQRHITRSVKLYKSRRDLFCNLMDTELGDMVKFIKPIGGMAIWTSFNDRYQLRELSRKLGIQGIYMNDGSRYDTTGIAPNSLRIGFASMNEKEMKTFIKELKSLKL